jgi:hypothetical protein
MLEKIIMIVSAALMLANEMLGLGYDKVEITAAVALIATIVAAAIRRLHGEAAADRLREKELDLELRIAELELLESRRGRPGARRLARKER